MGTAIRGRNVQRATDLLQVAPNASAADIDAASRRWGLDGSRSISDVIGVKTTSTTGWKRSTAQFDASTFAQADQLHSNCSPPFPRSRRSTSTTRHTRGSRWKRSAQSTPNVSDQLVIAQSTNTTYCAQLTSGQITWSERGPGGAPLPNAC